MYHYCPRLDSIIMDNSNERPSASLDDLMKLLDGEMTSFEGLQQQQQQQQQQHHRQQQEVTPTLIPLQPQRQSASQQHNVVGITKSKGSQRITNKCEYFSGDRARNISANV